MLDFIGDIHGHADQLKSLFGKLGYIVTKGVFHHPERKAFFLGDFVNRGSQVRQVLEIVRPMVEAGNAMAVAGNHEYNLLTYLTNDSFGTPLREHSEVHFRQLKDTLASFNGEQRLLANFLEWIKQLPLFFETHYFRVVHACWDEQSISFIKEQYPENRLTDSLLQASSIPGNPAYEPVQILLKGVEINLPSSDQWEDADGNVRQTARLTWWKDPVGKRLHELAARNIRQVDKYPDKAYIKRFPGYPAGAPPVFIGHYCMDGEPILLGPNVCCTDFCVYRSKRIMAYRWNGEQTLSGDHFIW